MEGANELVVNKGKLLVEGFESAAKEWAIESASEEGSRHFLKKFNSFKKRKKVLTNYILDLERNNAILLKDIVNLRATIREYEDRTGDSAIRTMAHATKKAPDGGSVREAQG
jgi:hypothetical protein